MAVSCTSTLKAVPVALSRKKSSRKPRAGLCNYHAGNPVDRVHVDIIGPLPVSNNGTRYVLMLVDQFTKWIEAYPIPDQTAETVARNIVDHFIARFGSLRGISAHGAVSTPGRYSSVYTTYGKHSGEH